jgi:hypothetical protein
MNSPNHLAYGPRAGMSSLFNDDAEDCRLSGTAPSCDIDDALFGGGRSACCDELGVYARRVLQEWTLCRRLAGGRNVAVVESVVRRDGECKGTWVE